MNHHTVKLDNLTKDDGGTSSRSKKPFVINPQGEHTHTAVLLHGRGSSGEEFAEELFASNGKALQNEFPGCKWIFPSAEGLYDQKFQEVITSWFVAPSLADPTEGQKLQIPEINKSVTVLSILLAREMDLLGQKKTGRVIVGGISQGGAIALWLLLREAPIHGQPLCAVFGASTWLPFAADIKSHLSSEPAPSQTLGFVGEMLDNTREVLRRSEEKHLILDTPVFMGHGSDDAYVGVELGREAVDVLGSIGLNVEWKEYEGAEQEGHWLKFPEEVDDIREFLAKVLAKRDQS